MKKTTRYITALIILLVIGSFYGYYKYTEESYTESVKILYANGGVFVEGQYNVRETLFGKEKESIGLWKSYHPNNIIRLQEEYDNDGTLVNQKEYSISGILISSFTEKNGLRLYAEYSDDGKLEFEITHTEESDGESSYTQEDETTYYENGQIKSKVRYIDGDVDGIYKEWYKSGQQKVEKEFSLGMLNGDYKMWDEQGTILLDVKFKDDVIEN